MEYSLLLARIFGPFLLVMGLAILLNKDRYQKIFKKMHVDEPLGFFAGAMSLFAGSWVLAVHNYWVSSWEVLITVLGVAMALKGIYILLWPMRAEKMMKKMLKTNMLGTAPIIHILLGVILIYFGFMA